MNVFRDNSIQGTPSATGAACLICGDKADIITVEDNDFAHCNGSAIQGAATNSSFAVKWIVSRNTFASFSKGAFTNVILNPDGAWSIETNTVEVGPVNSHTSLLTAFIDFSGRPCQGCIISGNWIGDNVGTPAFSGTLLKNIGGTNSSVSIFGNEFDSTFGSATLVSFASGASGVSVFGNTFLSGYLVFDFQSSNQTNVFVSGNTITGFMRFAGGALSTGIIMDNTGKATIYGNLSLNSPISNYNGTATVSNGVVRLRGCGFSRSRLEHSFHYYLHSTSKRSGEHLSRFLLFGGYKGG
jgi:hypothetical protein